MIDEDLDETARLVLMEQPEATLMQFAKSLREVMGDTLGLLEISDVWRRYRGWDGRVAATHSVETGRAFDRRWAS